MNHIFLISSSWRGQPGCNSCFSNMGVPICTQRNAVHPLICLNLWGRLTFFPFLYLDHSGRSSSHVRKFTVQVLLQSIFQQPLRHQGQALGQACPGYDWMASPMESLPLGHPRLPSGCLSFLSLRLQGHIRLCSDSTPKAWAYSWTLYSGGSTENLLNNGVSDWYLQYLTIYLFSNESIKKQLPILNDPVC